LRKFLWIMDLRDKALNNLVLPLLVHLVFLHMRFEQSIELMSHLIIHSRRHIRQWVPQPLSVSSKRIPLLFILFVLQLLINIILFIDVLRYEILFELEQFLWHIILVNLVKVLIYLFSLGNLICQVWISLNLLFNNSFNFLFNQFFLILNTSRLI
jgi:hypothetical protein